MVFMPHWPQILGSNRIDLGLDRVLKVLANLDNPHEKLPPVIHVAGTNGKGSTIAFLRSFLESAGYKVHVYTSPHLLNFNERIKLAGQDISDAYLYQIMEQCRIATRDIPITFFEGTTVGAFLAFSKIKADIVLLETGLGGRLDATNVIAKPAVTVITPVSIDHTEYLGPSIGLIAREKAGILKAGVPCISSLQSQDAYEVIQEKAQELNAPLSAFEYDWIVEKTAHGMIFKSPEYDIELPTPNLIGEHQLINSATAIAAIRQLQGFTIPDEALIKGIQNARWPARLQQLTRGPLVKKLPENWELWIDGAHNEAAAYTLANMLQNWDDRPTYLICGMTKGRDAGTFLKHFKGIAEFVCGVLVQTEPSAQKAQIIADAAKSAGLNTQAFESLDDALDDLCKRDAPKGARILCCGSLYLASDVLKANNSRV